MIAIWMTALCVGTAHALVLPPPPYYSCPVENSLRDLTHGFSTQDIPSLDQGKKDLDGAPEEIKNLAKEGLSKALAFSGVLQNISPFVQRCCPRPDYNCTAVNIPLRYIWFRGRFCFVIPRGRQLFYRKCTCQTCVRQERCPVVGRCVETFFVHVNVIAYCPGLLWPYTFPKLFVRLPTQCRCMSRCPPFPYYPYPRPYPGHLPLQKAAADTASDPDS